ALTKRRRDVTALTSRALDLKVDQAIQRDRGRHLAFDECVDVADVRHDARDESERAAAVSPRETRGNADLAAIADARLTHSGRGFMTRSDCLDHGCPQGDTPLP